MYAVFLEQPRTTVPGSNVGPVRVALREPDGSPALELLGSPATLSWAAAAADAAVLGGDLVTTVGPNAEAVFANVTPRATKPGAERTGHRLLFSADEGRVRAVSPPFALLGGLRVGGVTRHPLSRQVDFAAEVLHTDGSAQSSAEGLAVEARTRDGRVTTATVGADGQALFRGVTVPPGQSVVSVRAGNVSSPLKVSVGRLPVSLRIEGPLTGDPVAVGEPLGGLEGLRVVLHDELGQKAAADVAVTVSSGGRVLGKAVVDPKTATATVRGASLDSPGEHGVTASAEGLRSHAVRVRVQPAVPAAADVRVLSDTLDPPRNPEVELTRWATRQARHPEKLVRLSNVQSSMQGGVAFRVTLDPDPAGQALPPVLGLVVLRERARQGELKGTLPAELWAGDPEGASAGDASVGHPYRLLGGPAAVRGAAEVRFGPMPPRVWAGQPFSVELLFGQPGYPQKPARVSGARASFSLQSGSGTLTAPASRDLGRERVGATVPGLVVSEASAGVVLRAEVTFQDGSSSVASSPAFEVKKGSFHHRWCEDHPGLCPDIQQVPELEPPRTRPPVATGTPSPLVSVREPGESGGGTFSVLVRNCLPLMEDVVRIEAGTATEVRPDSAQLCQWALQQTRSSFEGAACSEEDRERCEAASAFAAALDRMAPDALSAVDATRDCVLASCRPRQKSAWLQAEQRLGAGKSSCAPGPLLSRKAAYQDSATVSLAALAVSAFVVWLFYLGRPAAPQPPASPRPAPRPEPRPADFSSIPTSRQ